MDWKVTRERIEISENSGLHWKIDIKRDCSRPLGKIPTHDDTNLERQRNAYEEKTLSMKCVYEWFARFRESQDSFFDKPRSGRPSTFTRDENVRKGYNQSKTIKRYGKSVTWDPAPCVRRWGERYPLRGVEMYTVKSSV
ncbi:hypothetical protein TNCV_4502481 [Trichonephila clavipes]|nr:hypothetical protein TNCV_4502481 [Trichonephila clavipes]